MPDTLDDLKSLAAKQKAEIDRLKAEAGALWKSFDDLRTSAAKEGVDFLKDADAFAKMNDAGVAYDAKRVEIDKVTDEWHKTLGLTGLAAPENPLDSKGLDPNRPDGGGLVVAKSLGERYVSSDEYKAAVATPGFGNTSIQMGTIGAKEITSRAEAKTLITGSSSTSGGAFIVNDRQDGMVELPRRPLTLADLVTVGDTDSDLVEYVEQTSRTNAAAETAEASATGDGSGAAPESAAAFAVRQASVQDITHFIPATRNAISDAGQMQTIINGEVSDGILERLDSQIANGNGTAPNLPGIYGTNGILNRALGADTRSDAVHKAITQVRLQFFEPEVIGLHPNDAEQMFLEKDTTGNYIYGPPSMPVRGSVWGLRPVVSPVFLDGTPLIGNYRRGAALWLREGVSIAVSDSHADFFTRRMIAVLGVMRAAFAVQRPKCFCTVTGF